MSLASSHTHSSCDSSSSLSSRADDAEIDIGQTHHFSEQLRVLQWNVRGIISNSGAFFHQTDENNPDICMLQELGTKYSTTFQAKNFRSWDYHGDCFGKTGIYIKHYITHGYIPLDIISSTSEDVRDCIYCTSAWVEVQHRGSKCYIILVNLYMSPSGHVDFGHLDLYLNKIKTYADTRLDGNIMGWIVGGDVNASQCYEMSLESSLE